eukprot:5395075-Ditylum_brightwellii.AAC.1
MDPHGSHIPITVDTGKGMEKATYLSKPSDEKMMKMLAKKLCVVGATNRKYCMESIVDRLDIEFFEMEKLT